LLNVTSGEDEVTLDEISAITEYIQREAGYDTNIIWGNCSNISLGKKISVTIIATGFDSKMFDRVDSSKNKTKVNLEDVTAMADGSIIEINRPIEVKPAAEIVLENEIELNPTVTTEMQKETEVLVETEMEEMKLVTREVKAEGSSIDENSLSHEERMRRIQKLRGLSMNKPADLTEMENEPAYKRRNLNLKDTPHSSDSNISTLYMSDGENGKSELKKNNTFLHGHDKVD
jgi:cell division protein FtsZ